MTRCNDQIGRQPRVLVCWPAAYLLLFILLAPCPRAGAQQIQLAIGLAIGSAAGPPGGTADIPFTLTDPTITAVGAGLFVTFPAGTLDALSINLPEDCVIAQRLATTHILAAIRLNRPPGGQGFDLEVAPNPNAPGSPNLPIDTGEIATCTFRIPESATLGSVTTLTASNVLVTDANLQRLDATGENGEVTVALVTPTPTVTNTPVEATNTPTATNTPVQPTNTPTATNTPVNTPTATNTPVQATATTTRTSTPVATNTSAAGFGEGGGCSIAASGGADASPLAWLIVPAALLLRRRRAQR
jgi:MYXO-CTERM domain-containing protein